MTNADSTDQRKILENVTQQLEIYYTGGSGRVLSWGDRCRASQSTAAEVTAHTDQGPAGLLGPKGLDSVWKAGYNLASFAIMER